MVRDIKIQFEETTHYLANVHQQRRRGVQRLIISGTIMREAVARHSDSADRLNNGRVLLINSVNPHNGEKQIRETIGENGGARAL